MEELHDPLEIQLEHEDGPGGHGCPGDPYAGSLQILLLTVERQAEDKLVL